MRLALLLLCMLLAGCIERPPAIEVLNSSTRDARGVATMWLDAGWRNETEEETGRWEFDVAAGERLDLGRLPREPAEYHYMVVRLEDGREGWGRPLNHAHVGALLIEVLEDAVEVHAQSVR